MNRYPLFYFPLAVRVGKRGRSFIVVRHFLRNRKTEQPQTYTGKLASSHSPDGQPDQHGAKGQAEQGGARIDVHDGAHKLREKQEGQIRA